MKHDRQPFISLVDRHGGRVIIRAGSAYDALTVTVRTGEGVRLASEVMTDGEAHIKLPMPLGEQYSLLLTYPKPRLKPTTPPAKVATPSGDAPTADTTPTD